MTTWSLYNIFNQQSMTAWSFFNKKYRVHSLLFYMPGTGVSFILLLYYR